MAASYKLVFWLLFTVTTSVFVIDRFTTNVWPRQWFTTKNHITATDNVPFKDGPVTVFLYDVIARFSGRYTMAGLNALFFTMMHTLHRYLSNTKLGIYFIDFRDDVARMQIHKWIGISICVITIVHVWSVLFPVWFSGYSVEVHVGHFTWPLSEIAPEGFQSVNSTTKIMMLEVDDVWRLSLMTVLLGPLVYLSYRWLGSNHRLGIRLHQFVMLMYFIDIVRRHSHPHTWVFNIPVFFIWIIDRIWGHFYLAQTTTVSKIKLSPNYMLLLWKSTHTTSRYVPSIGDLFFMRRRAINSYCWCCGSSSCCDWERDHPFTSFNRRAAELSSMQCLVPYNSKLKVNFGSADHIDLVSNEQIKVSSDSEDIKWDKGVVIRSYKEPFSHTKLMRDSKKLWMDIWGGFLTGDIADYINAGEDVILIGGGSGSGYLIDTLLYLCENRIDLDGKSKDQNNEERGGTTNYSRVGIIFTSNDLYLVQWWTNIIDNMLKKNKLPLSKCLGIRISLTTGNGASHGVKSLTTHGISWGKVSLGRCKIENEIRTMTQKSKNKGHVFCQGGESLQNACEKAAKHTGKRYHAGHSYDNAKQQKGKTCCCSSLSPV